jgi:C4-dicarboxylate-specific signal transduction histidine kinase
VDQGRGHDHAGNEPDLNPLLLTELNWIIKLRWGVGGAVVILAIANQRFFDWFDRPTSLLVVGVAILLFNLAMAVFFRRRDELAGKPRVVTAIATTQVLFDLACLTFLSILTGGVFSPVVGFFVFHMVFASTLLSRRGANIIALAAIAMLLVGLVATEQWPDDRASVLLALGWAVTLLLTTYLAGRLAKGVRRREQRLMEKNREIREMSDQLRAQQQSMIQHEKMVAIGRLAAGVSHEIANPLANMDSVLQLMERRPEKPRTDAIHNLREQIGRINTIVRGMTSFAHQDPGAFVAHDVNDVVRTSLDMMAFDRRMRAVNVEQHLSDTTGNARMIPQALQQVLVNLISNALDAMEGAASPRLTVRTERTDRWCVIEIEDNGHGIAPEIQARVFEPFFTTKPVGRGTGLGLSICFSLIRDQRGELAVQSEPGRTVFRVSLECDDCQV